MYSAFLFLFTGQFCSSGRQRGDLCYVIKRETLTWQESQVKCQGDGGDLVAIDNQATQTFIENYLRDEGVDQVWVGGKEQPDSDWMWVRGNINSFKLTHTVYFSVYLTTPRFILEFLGIL